MIGIGIDPSTYCGFAAIAPDGWRRTKLAYFKEQTGFDRVQSIARSVVGWAIENAPLNDYVVCIEGYGHGTHGNVKSFVTSVEIGTAIRLGLYQARVRWYDVPPSVLKKVTTGKGNATKKEMAAAILERWGLVSDSDDVLDAYALAQMALVIGQTGVPKEWRGVVRS